MSNDELILSEYEYLLKAKRAYFDGCKFGHTKYLDKVREDLGSEYMGNIDNKIERWIDITNYMLFKSSKPVEFYIQAKMLYRDGFFEASIAMARTICEMIAHDLLKGISHPFGTPDEIENKGFRELISYLYKNTSMIVQESYKKLHKIYDVGNNYVHPKSPQNPKVDARICLIDLGDVVFQIYGVLDIKEGMAIETAYNKFPAICNCYHLLIEVYDNLEAAFEDDFLCLECPKHQK